MYNKVNSIYPKLDPIYSFSAPESIFRILFVRVHMDKNHGKTVLITGASSGIGASIADILVKEGYRVYGTSRKEIVEWNDDTKTKCTGNPGFFKMLQLDICSEVSVKKAVDYVLREEGTIDVLINNAGFGIAGSVEDTTTDEAIRQFDTNFFGVHRMCRAVLPVMRKQRRGLIINISSVAGFVSIPFQSMYSASKYALEAMTEALRIETKPFGVKVVLVEPGDTKTGFTKSRCFAAAADKDSDYRERFTKSINVMIKDETNGASPASIAKIVSKVVRMKSPPVRITVGMSYKMVAFLKRVVPARFAEFIISRIYA